MSQTKPKDVGERGRIENRFAGAAAPTPETVDRRAREIARIEGRAPAEVTQDDIERARRELMGDTVPLASEGAHSDLTATHDPSAMVTETGHEVEPVSPPDEQQVPEEETKEGVREAEHERMLKGKKR